MIDENEKCGDFGNFNTCDPYWKKRCEIRNKCIEATKKEFDCGVCKTRVKEITRNVCMSNCVVPDSFTMKSYNILEVEGYVVGIVYLCDSCGDQLEKYRESGEKVPKELSIKLIHDVAKDGKIISYPIEDFEEIIQIPIDIEPENMKEC